MGKLWLMTPPSSSLDWNIRSADRQEVNEDDLQVPSTGFELIIGTYPKSGTRRQPPKQGRNELDAIGGVGSVLMERCKVRANVVGVSRYWSKGDVEIESGNQYILHTGHFYRSTVAGRT